ncbi:MAG: chorismate-binding protein [Acidimicrobiales bacterium]
MAEPDDFVVAAGRLLTGMIDVTSDVAALDGSGQWAVVLPYDAAPVCARFSSVQQAASSWPRSPAAPPMTLSASGGWRSSLGRPEFVKGVTTIREAIGAGDVYQVNLCRRLSTPVPEGFDIVALASALADRNPAPHAAVVNLPSIGMRIVSASPERFLRRDRELVESEPIKGTAVGEEGLTDKDRAENVMIVDLVRNDLGRVCRYGSVSVAALCRTERHPGLVHLVSTVRGRLRAGIGWPAILDATFPPGSVTGAPKHAAMGMIEALEPCPRRAYCGAIGWVDADRRQADLNVAIRTFWVEDGMLNLGTGAGITWGSDAEEEWAETELKARRLLAVATGSTASLSADSASVEPTRARP